MEVGRESDPEASPHAGKEPRERRAWHQSPGSIPARGEGTSSSVGSSSQSRKHPRTRGRNRAGARKGFGGLEASPHAGKERLDRPMSENAI